MTPYKHGAANRGHSCVKGRFAYGYATHSDRILNPMIRETIDQPWREVSWEEAIGFAADKFRGIQAKYGRKSVGVITSSRCTKRGNLPRAEDDARGLPQQQHRHLRSGSAIRPRATASARLSAPARARRISTSVQHVDVAVIIGANPTDGHPVFRQRLKKRLRQGAKLIVNRSAPDRPCEIRACRGGPSPAPAPRHQRRGRHGAGACDR